MRERERAQIDAWRDQGHLWKVCVYVRESTRAQKDILINFVMDLCSCVCACVCYRESVEERKRERARADR